jgi:hypothetical protein
MAAMILSSPPPQFALCWMSISKKLLVGAVAAKVLNRDAMADAESVDWFVKFACACDRARGAGPSA